VEIGLSFFVEMGWGRVEYNRYRNIRNADFGGSDGDGACSSSVGVATRIKLSKGNGKEWLLATG
jgi:hypothetical protein